MARALPALLVALLLAAPAVANGPHVQLYFFAPPGLKPVPADAYWEANFTGQAGQEIVASVVRTKGNLDILYMDSAQFGAYRAALASGIPFDAGPAAVKLRAARADLNFRVETPGVYHLVIDNTPLPGGGAPGDAPAEAYVLFATTAQPGAAGPPPDPLLSVVGNVLSLSVVLGLAAFAAVAFNKLPAAEAKRGLLAGGLAAPVFGGIHGALTWLLLLPFEGPGGSLAAAMGMLGAVEGLYAIPFGLSFLGARRVLAGGPVKQGVVLAGVAWGIFVLIPWLQSPAATSQLDLMLLLDELASFLALGAAAGWFWAKLEKRPPAASRGGKTQAPAA
ncbi:MAG: hypothetical protein QXO51_03570 [Halobacteria archaeon]